MSTIGRRNGPSWNTLVRLARAAEGMGFKENEIGPLFRRSPSWFRKAEALVRAGGSLTRIEEIRVLRFVEVWERFKDTTTIDARNLGVRAAVSGGVFRLYERDVSLVVGEGWRWEGGTLVRRPLVRAKIQGERGMWDAKRIHIILRSLLPLARQFELLQGALAMLEAREELEKVDENLIDARNLESPVGLGGENDDDHGRD